MAILTVVACAGAGAEASIVAIEHGAAAAAPVGGTARVAVQFDEGCKSTQITLTDVGKVMRTSQAGRFHVYATVPLTRAAGGGTFDFLYKKDKVGDEGLCFGFGVKPVTGSSYESANAFVVRCVREWCLIMQNERLLCAGASIQWKYLRNRQGCSRCAEAARGKHVRVCAAVRVNSWLSRVAIASGSSGTLQLGMSCSL